MVDNQPMWKYAINHLQILPNLWINSFALRIFFFRVCIILVVQIYIHILISGMHFLLTLIIFGTILFPIHYNIFEYSNCNIGKPGWFCFWWILIDSGNLNKIEIMIRRTKRAAQWYTTRDCLIETKCMSVVGPLNWNSILFHT